MLAIRQDPCLRCWPHCSSRASILASPHQRTTQQAQQGGTTQLHSNTHHANSGHAASGAPATPKHTGPTAYVRSLEPLNSSTSALASATDCALPALERDQQHICAETDAEQSNGHPQYVLFAIDGTWQEAKEIYKVHIAFKTTKALTVYNFSHWKLLLRAIHGLIKNPRSQDGPSAQRSIDLFLLEVHLCFDGACCLS